MNTVLETWSPEDGKGLDDALTNGRRPDLLEGDAAAAEVAEVLREAGADATRIGWTLDDFRSFSQDSTYICIPTGDQWPASKVNGQLPPVFTGEIDEDGKKKYEAPTRWLDREAPAHQMTWAPGEPKLIRDRLLVDGGWFAHPGGVVYNQFRPAAVTDGDASREAARPWLRHLKRIYPDDAIHILYWFAHRVQRPGEKVNHALVLGGPQGIGKDTLIDPVQHAVGAWNCAEVSPVELLGRFNGFRKNVMLRVSEARDLGDMDRYAFYEHSKTLLAAPPPTLRIDEKNRREYVVPNVVGVIITSNHLLAGIYLPADDRRHYVAWSEATKDEFTAEYWRELWEWYDAGGRENVAAYLRETVDLSRFNPKAPPPKTEPFHAIVNANRAPEDGELADAIAALRDPSVISKEMLLTSDLVSLDFKEWLQDRRNNRKIGHRLEAAGYSPVRNPVSADGRWTVAGRNVVLYGRRNLTERDRIAAAETLAFPPRTPCTP